MASDYSTRIRLEKQGSGENANTWGERLNQNVVSLVDAAIAGVTAVDVNGAGGTGVTLTTNNGSPDQARSLGLRMTGTLAADVTVTYSTSPEKIYFVNNETVGGYNVIMNNGSTMVTVGDGAALIATNGSNSYAIRDFESGTRLAFNQNTAPQGWTVITSASHNGAGLRIVNAATSGAQVGGSNEFTSVFNSAITISNITGATNNATLTGNTDGTALTRLQIPPHNHTIAHREVADRDDDENKNTVIGGGTTTTSNGNVGENGDGTGNAAEHLHSLEGLGEHSHTGVSASGSFNLNVKYVNFIVCEKD